MQIFKRIYIQWQRIILNESIVTTIFNDLMLNLNQGQSIFICLVMITMLYPRTIIDKI